MHTFYQNLTLDDAVEIEQISRLMYEIRSARDGLLAQLGVSGDADQALARIAGGELPEHPSYEQYLSARILAGLHADVRADLAARLQESKPQ